MIPFDASDLTAY